MKNIIKCPYLSKNKKCSHNYGIKRNGRKMCIFNNQMKCPLYRKWFNKLCNESFIKNIN